MIAFILILLIMFFIYCGVVGFLRWIWWEPKPGDPDYEEDDGWGWP